MDSRPEQFKVQAGEQVMTIKGSVFQTSSSLLDNDIAFCPPPQSDGDESDISRVAEFFCVLRSRLQHELPATANLFLTESAKQSLIETMERARRVKPR